MGEINFTDFEKSSLKAIDDRELEKMLDRAIDEEHTQSLARLPLSSCGAYVATHLSRFEDALRTYRSSVRKRDEALYDVRRARERLYGAFVGIKRQMEQGERDAELFYVEDHVHAPSYFSEDLEVTVSYRWRRAAVDEWSYGWITFSHNAKSRPDYLARPPKRKPTAAQRARNEQKRLFDTWDHLRQTALYTVRDYFKGGGDGSNIPSQFKVKTDSTGGLNNYSARFWQG